MERLLQDVGGSLHSPNEDMDAHRVIADMNELDERIRSSEQADLINSERDILHQQAIMSQYNNPMTYLTPILIASLVIVSVLVVVCMCGGGFCWYVRFNKKEEERERDLEQQRMIHPNNHNNSYSAAIYAENNYLVEQRKANSDSFATSSVRSSSRSTSRRPHDSDKGSWDGPASGKSSAAQSGMGSFAPMKGPTKGQPLAGAGFNSSKASGAGFTATKPPSKMSTTPVAGQRVKNKQSSPLDEVTVTDFVKYKSKRKVDNTKRRVKEKRERSTNSVRSILNKVLGPLSPTRLPIYDEVRREGDY